MSIKITKNNFTGGKAEDPYRATASQYSSSIGFDTSRKGRLRSHRDVEDTTPSAAFVTETLAFAQISTGDLLALGRATTSQNARILSKATPSSAWTNPGNNQTATPGLSGEMFVEYFGYMYFWTGNGQISRWAIDGSVMNTDWFDTTIGTFTNGPGFFDTGSNFLYFAQDNILYGTQYDNGTGLVPFPTIQLQFAPSYEIVSIDATDSYLVIGLKHKSKANQSFAAFWQRLGPKPSFIKKIPAGKLEILRVINDEVVALSTYSDGDGLSSIISQETRLIVSVYDGYKFSTRKDLVLSYDDITINISERSGTEKDGFIYFALTSSKDTVYSGVYKFGSNKTDYIITEDRFVTLEIATNQPLSIVDIEFFGDCLFASFENYQNAQKVTKTVESKLYLDLLREHTTEVFVVGKRGDSKKINNIWVTTAPLFNETQPVGPNNVEVYFAVDEQSTEFNAGEFYLAGTHDADTKTESTFVSSDEQILPPRCNNITLKLKGNGLVQITEYGIEYDDIMPELNSD